MASSPVGRRGFLRGAGLGGLGLGGPAAVRLRHPGAKQTARVVRQQGPVGEREDAGLLQLAALHRREGSSGRQEVTLPIAREFEKESGIKVNYITDVNDNTEFFGKCAQPARRLPAHRPRHHDADRLDGRPDGQPRLAAEARQGQHAQRRGQPRSTLQVADWDKNRDYSVPWQSGLTGIAYNAKLTKRGAQLRRAAHPPGPQGQGQPALGDARHDAVHARCSTGADPGTSPTTSGTRPRPLQQAADAGQIRAFTGNEYTQDLVKGNIVACEAWSGDVIQLQFDNPDIKFVAPEEGLALWSDNMLVPNKATPPDQRRGADELLLRPGSPQARGLGQLHLPGRGRPAGHGEDRPQPRRQPADLPDSDTLAKAKDFMGLDEKTEQSYQKQFAAVIGA